jgi:hypothetical protein
MEYAKHVPVNKKIRDAEFFSGTVNESGGFFFIYFLKNLFYGIG